MAKSKFRCGGCRSPYRFLGPDQDKTWADPANRYPENVPGKFYVDDQCIDCDLCRETAPANFKRNDDGGHSYVYKQAENPEEEARCKERWKVARSKPSATTAKIFFCSERASQDRFLFRL